MEPVVVYRSRKRLFLLLLAAIAFVAGLAWVATLPVSETSFKRIVAIWAGIPLFSLGGLVALKEMLSNKPAVIIDRNGFTDNSSAQALGFIPWRDISSAGIIIFSVYKNKQTYLGIGLTEPQQCLAKANLLRRIPMRWNLSRFGYVVVVSADTLKLSVEQLLQHVENFSAAAGQPVVRNSTVESSYH